MQRVYLSLGANLGNREQALQEAIRQIHSPDLRITSISSVYETQPQNVPNQPWFLNMVVAAETTLFPVRLLLRVSNIERKMGRRRTVLKGPRVIDIDILLHGDFVINTQQLKVPHPRMTERRFVLEPLCEIAPDLRHPQTKKKLCDLLAATMNQVCHKSSFLPSTPEENQR